MKFINIIIVIVWTPNLELQYPRGEISFQAVTARRPDRQVITNFSAVGFANPYRDSNSGPPSANASPTSLTATGIGGFTRRAAENLMGVGAVRVRVAGNKTGVVVVRRKEAGSKTQVGRVTMRAAPSKTQVEPVTMRAAPNKTQVEPVTTRAARSKTQV